MAPILAVVPQPGECAHGCRKPSDCLRYDQGGSIPQGCLLEARDPWATTACPEAEWAERIAAHWHRIAENYRAEHR